MTLDKEIAREKYRLGIAAGLLVALVSLGGAIYFGTAGQWWGTAILSGPSLIALAKIFVLRQSDPGDMQAVLGAVNVGGSQGSAQRVRQEIAPEALSGNQGGE